jgi:hypothetical protein
MAKFIIHNTGAGTVTLRTPRNNYRTIFRLPDGAVVPGPGEPVHGEIRALAWKAEPVSLGGNYIEPLEGRPRRMQGNVLEVIAASNELRVKTPYEVIVKLPEKYQAAQFPIGTRVGFDCIEVPIFIPASQTAAAAPVSAGQPAAAAAR